MSYQTNRNRKNMIKHDERIRMNQFLFSQMPKEKRAVHKSPRTTFIEDYLDTDLTVEEAIDKFSAEKPVFTRPILERWLKEDLANDRIPQGAVEKVKEYLVPVLNEEKERRQEIEKIVEKAFKKANQGRDDDARQTRGNKERCVI